MKNLHLPLLFAYFLSVAFAAKAHETDSTKTFTLSSISEGAFAHRMEGANKGKSAFYLPAVKLAASLELGKGWTITGEVEAAQPNAIDEAGDFSLVLSEFIIEKHFFPALSLKAGLFNQPLGQTGVRDNPTDFFSIALPASEAALIPFCIADAGLSIRGEAGKFGYEAMVASELKAFTLRADYFMAEGIQAGLSAHHRNCKDTLDSGEEAKFTLAAFDFLLGRRQWILRANALYRHAAPIASKRENALGLGLEAGYDFLSLSKKQSARGRKLYAFARYDYADTLLGGSKASRCSDLAVGLNFMPLHCIVVKAQYATRFQHADKNKTPELGLSIAFQGNLFKMDK